MKKQLGFLMAALMLTAAITSCAGNEGTTVETAEGTAAETAAVVETEAVTTEAITTEPVETEPPLVEVFTPVYEENFDDAKAANWKNNVQIKQFKIENGMIHGISTGGDPSFCNKNDFNLDCSAIHAIKIKFLNCTPSDAFQIFFTTDSIPGYNESASFKDISLYCDSAEDATDEWNEMVIYTEDCPDWTGTLKDMRIDFANGEGAFYVDSIGFYTVTMEPAQ
ncbi:MAG: hypothetical protein IKZ09_02085 [Clostridia bacterium]|nr:hypothetical protein [Clostridia bacterium]